jgi:ATP-binding cassette subfamily B multidrug efflux pump
MTAEPQDDQIAGKAYDARLMRRLLSYIRPHRRAAALALLYIMAGSGLSVLPPLLTKTAIDRFISRGDLSGLNRIALLYVLTLVAVFWFSYGQAWVLNVMGQKIMVELRMSIFRHLQRLEIAFFDRNPVGRLMTRVTTDVDALNELFTAGVISVVGDVCTLAGIVVVLFLINVKLALAIFSVVPLLFLITFVFKLKVRDSFRRVRTAVARINAFLQENLTGSAVVQLFHQEEKQYRRFVAVNREHLEANLQSIFYYALFYPLLELVGALAVALIVWYGGLQVFAGTLTLGALVAFIQYSERFFRPISDLSEKYNILQQAMASAERIFKLLDTRPAIASPARPRRAGVREGSVEFRNVSFAYTPGTPVLQDISFAVEPGERVALVGATGAGKSTVIALLSRFYDVVSGQILVDGIDIRDYDLQGLRRSIGVVLQDVFLFSGTVADNIRLGNEAITDEAMRGAIEAAQAWPFIRRLDRQLDTPVGERGSTLSAGQRQLLAFARALAHDPRILVLDEATSSIDTETEIMIRQALARLLEGRTAIMIAHRLSTIQRADRIIVLHHGRIRETGTHQELLHARGIYWKLYQLQYQDQLPAPPAPAPLHGSAS